MLMTHLTPPSKHPRLSLEGVLDPRCHSQVRHEGEEAIQGHGLTEKAPLEVSSKPPQRGPQPKALWASRPILDPGLLFPFKSL